MEMIFLKLPTKSLTTPQGQADIWSPTVSLTDFFVELPAPLSPITHPKRQSSLNSVRIQLPQVGLLVVFPRVANTLRHFNPALKIKAVEQF